MDTRRYQLLEAVLLSVAHGDVSAVDTALTGFAAMQGRNCRDGLTVIGRAVNGWTNSWTVRELRNTESRTKILGEIANFVEITKDGTDCPMAWVVEQWGNEANYNTARSAFWRCIRRVATDLGIADPEARDWSSRLMWTNLYKIAPASGGNPPGALASAQHTSCRELLHAEIEGSAARHVLFLTGLEWAYAFLPALEGAIFAKSFHDDVSLSGTIQGANDTPIGIVVASHPQGKSEDRWTAQVLQAFQRLNDAEQCAASDRPPAARSPGG